jgi:hypothetical protein
LGVAPKTSPLACAAPPRHAATLPLFALLLCCQACAHSGATSALPEWIRTPAQQRGTQLLFVGQGEASNETEALAAALRAAREEAARVQGVRIESELRSQVGQIGMAGQGGSATLSWERVAQSTRERTSAVLTRAVPFGETVTQRRGSGVVVWARIAVEESDLFPWTILDRAAAPEPDGASSAVRLIEAARQLEARGEATLAELALRRAVQSQDSAGADAALIELGWFLQRQGREAEAALWLRRLGDLAQLSVQLRESAERLQRTLTVEPRVFDRYLEDLLRLVQPYVSDARLRLRPLPRQAPRAEPSGTPIEADFLLDLRDAAREIVVLWIDSTGVRVEFPMQGSKVPRGVQTLTLDATRGLGDVALVVVGAETVASLARIPTTARGLLVRRWHGEGTAAEDETQALQFRGLLESLATLLRQDRTAAAAFVRVRMD